MSNTQLPAHLANYQTPDIGATLSANLGSAMPPHVSISDNRFTLIDASNNEIPVPTFDPQIGVYLDAAIIDVNNVMSRIYFDGPYDKGAEGKRPDCFSDNGIGPSISAGSPQAPTCAACPRSEWTKVNANGNKVPWCTQKQKVALLIPGMPTLFLLAVPPNSHGPLREYVNHCKGNGSNIADLVTRMWFVSQGTIGFRPVSYIDVPAAELRQRAYAEKKTDSLVGRNDVARPAGAIAAPVQHPGVQIPQTQSAPQNTAQGQQWPVQTQLMYPPHPNPSTQQQGAPVQQVQQPGPFGATPAPGAGGPGWPQQNPAPTAATTSPSDGPSPTGMPAGSGRRKRRTQAEIAAANGAAQQPAGGQQQAPFPHPGQQTGPFGAQPATNQPTQQAGAGFATQPATSSSQPQQLEFGIGQGQPASANPDVQSALNDFFGGQS